jgi:glycosyltransferase involved in cell wall biosynthesis
MTLANKTSNRTEIHQLVHTLSYGDAISGEVIALRRVLRGLGFTSEIYAINTHPHYKGETRDQAAFLETHGTSFTGEIILHYSLGSPLNAVYQSLTQAKRTLIYHNLTPPEWFASVNTRIVHDIEAGVKELPTLCAQSTRVLADSSFNASEIKALGFAAEVLRLPIDPERWAGSSNPGIAAMLKAAPGIHVLHVGRLAPNKCIEDLIRSFYFLHHHIEKKSKLWLVGIDIDTEIYSFALKRLMYELHLEEAINFVGCLADSEVRALYENASVYCCMSEHEGFCLPLVEAMHFGLPIIAYASSAVPETVGNGGILVHEKRPAEIAELLYRVATDTALRAQLIAAGKAQVATLSFSEFETCVANLFQRDNYASARDTAAQSTKAALSTASGL